MKISLLIVFTLFILCNCRSSVPSDGGGEPINPSKKMEFWVTDPTSGILFEKRSGSFTKVNNVDLSITVDTTSSFQSVDGFGNCLTGGSAMLINKMSPIKRNELLRELFSNQDKGIGISYLRISIGASDLSDHVFSYNDLPSGESDVTMSKFSIDPERKDLIPVLKEILSINPKLKILGSPWSAPVWMKTNNSSKGGSLRPEFFDAYALYFVKYIQAMAAEGIPIDAITIQNEPLHPGNNPSMYMTSDDQALFIKKSLGPAFTKANIKTKIIVYDHNADRPDYPMAIYKDAEAAQYVDGAAFHLYAGSIEALSTVHDAYPSKNLYFTEQWIGAPGNLSGDLSWHIKTLIIGATRNWSRNVLEWNLASDPAMDPHTEGGCDQCLGTVTISGDQWIRNPAWYILGHSAKLIVPGSVRIGSNSSVQLPNVAFKTPEGKKVLIVLNDSGTRRNFNIVFDALTYAATLEKGAVGTYIW